MGCTSSSGIREQVDAEHVSIQKPGAGEDYSAAGMHEVDIHDDTQAQTKAEARKPPAGVGEREAASHRARTMHRKATGFKGRPALITQHTQRNKAVDDDNNPPANYARFATWHKATPPPGTATRTTTTTTSTSKSNFKSNSNAVNSGTTSTTTATTTATRSNSNRKIITASSAKNSSMFQTARRAVSGSGRRPYIPSFGTMKSSSSKARSTLTRTLDSRKLSSSTGEIPALQANGVQLSIQQQEDAEEDTHNRSSFTAESRNSAMEGVGDEPRSTAKYVPRERSSPELDSKETVAPSMRITSQMTAREQFFGYFQQNNDLFKRYYSRPMPFWYEQSSYYKSLEKGQKEQDQQFFGAEKEFRLTSQALQVPYGEHEYRWLGKHAVHFFNATASFYNRISRLCTKSSCPIMGAGPKYVYNWKSETSGKIIEVSAPRYMRSLFAWLHEQISDRALFPLPEVPDDVNLDLIPEDDLAVPMDHFSGDFRSVVSNMLRRLFRVYAHLYWVHFKRIQAIGLQAELYNRFYHLVYFLLEFNLVPSRDLRPLRSLIMARLPASLTESIQW